MLSPTYTRVFREADGSLKRLAARAAVTVVNEGALGRVERVGG